MSRIKTLEKYTMAMLAVAACRQKHAKVFDELDSFKIAAQDAEDKLKADVKENIKMNVSNEFVKVTYSPAFRKRYIYDIIIGQTTPKQRKALEDARALVHDVDKTKFEELVEQGVIPVEIKQAAFEEKELAPRVSIKEITQNE